MFIIEILLIIIICRFFNFDFKLFSLFLLSKVWFNESDLNILRVLWIVDFLILNVVVFVGVVSNIVWLFGFLDICVNNWVVL